MAIPKVIHYCWFGGGVKPDCFEKCYASWKKYAPDYEIIEWNESNVNIDEHPFMQQAYAAKKYAFVSDVARLSIIYRYGGIYLDTDVELRGPLDDLLKHQSFFFFNTNGEINTGLGFGAEKGHPIVAKILDDYREFNFSIERIKQLACPVINTDSIISMIPTFKRSDTTVCYEDSLFCSSYDYKKYALHYYENSWISAAERKADKYKKYNRGKKRFWGIRRVLRNPKIFDFLVSHNMNKISRIYGVLVFDVLDNGLLYYTYRFYQKITGDNVAD